MPRITIHVGARERLEPAISKATPLGALGTEALVWIGATCISGSATALRALADALVEAAELADDYDTDPDAFNRASRPTATPTADLLDPDGRRDPPTGGHTIAGQRPGIAGGIDASARPGRMLPSARERGGRR